MLTPSRRRWFLTTKYRLLLISNYPNGIYIFPKYPKKAFSSPLRAFFFYHTLPCYHTPTHPARRSRPLRNGSHFKLSPVLTQPYCWRVAPQRSPFPRPAAHQNYYFFLTSSTCHPKFVGKERCNALMTFHEHCFADCLLVLRKVYLYCYDCLCERQHFVDAHPDL